MENPPGGDTIPFSLAWKGGITDHRITSYQTASSKRIIPWRLINRYGLPRANDVDGYYAATAGDHVRNPLIHLTHPIER
eukprot:scaffold47789_cov32-Cyclotella_meneghiniana.AAC.2